MQFKDGPYLIPAEKTLQLLLQEVGVRVYGNTALLEQKGLRAWLKDRGIQSYP